MKKNDYIPLMRFTDVPMLIDFFYLEPKIEYDVLSINLNGERTVYFSKENYEKSLNDGKAFHKNQKRFKKDLKTKGVEFKEITQKIAQKRHVTFQDVLFFGKAMSDFYELYDLTDYYFTDNAHKIIENKIPEFGKLKENMREIINEVLMSENGLCYVIFKKIATQINSTFENIINLTLKELEHGFKTGTVPDVTHRKNKYILLVKDKKITYVEDENIIKEFSQRNYETKLKGVIASKGKVTAHARVFPNNVLSFKELEQTMKNMKKGEILVAETTSPEIMPACNKAIGIITNQGGIMSHAAIVARELDIPCIVGTNNATKVLKTGDLVEVDANEGMVKILKNNSLINDKSLDINLDDWEFDFKQRDDHPIIMADQWSKSLAYKLKQEVEIDVPAYDYLTTGTSRMYVKKKHKKIFLSKFNVALKDEKYLQKLFKKTMRRVNELDAFANKSLKCDDLSLLWKEFNDIMLRFVPWYYIPWYLSETNILIDRVNKGLKHYKEDINKITDLNNALSLLTFPVKKTILQQEQEKFYELVKLAKEEKYYTAKAKKYLSAFSWTKCFIELPIEPLSFKELEEKIDEAVKGTVLQEKELQDKQKIKNEKIINKLMNIFSNDKTLQRDIINARELGWLLSFSVEKSLSSFAKLIPFFKKIAQNIGVRYEDWVHFTIDEIQNGLNGAPLDTKSLPQRRLSYVYLMENGKRTIIFGKDALSKTKRIDKEINKIDKKINKFKGKPVSSGFVKGIVKIVPRAQDAKNLKEGEILVCDMTSPDYVPAMKRCGAIITDEGSILCHAAIVSREIGKPCIVSTKLATKVLKTGDLVEVDANEGVVKILKKND